MFDRAAWPFDERQIEASPHFAAILWE